MSTIHIIKRAQAFIYIWPESSRQMCWLGCQIGSRFNSYERFFFSFLFCSKFSFLFSTDTNMSARWYNWLHRQPTDVSSFQLLESFQMLYFDHLQKGAYDVLFSRWPWRSHRPGRWQYSSFSNIHLSTNVKTRKVCSFSKVWRTNNISSKFICFFFFFLQ